MNPLQSAFQAATAHLALDDRCTTCGAPSPEGQLVVILKPDEELPKCPECGGSVDKHGRPCGQLYNGHMIPVKIIVLPEPPPWKLEEVVAPR